MDKDSVATLGSQLGTAVLGKESKMPPSRVDTHYIVGRRWIRRFADQFRCGGEWVRVTRFVF